MTLILSGTDGLSDVDGTAATPAIRGTDVNTGIFFGTDIIGFSEGGVEAARINADSQFVAAAGTAALPVITTTGDTNTGIFFPAADTIAFSEGGAESMRIDSSGNVGIGTSSPSYKLSVAGSTTGEIAIQAINASSGNTGYRMANSLRSWAIFVNDDSSGPLRFYDYTAAAERMRIDSSGNVGIGTASPLGKVTIFPSDITTKGINAGSALVLGSGGNTNSLAQINFTQNSSSTFSPASIGYVITTSSASTFGDLYFSTRAVNTDTAPTERMRINSSGNVGIGTTSPGTNGAFEIRRAVTTGAMTNCSFSTSDAANSTFDVGHPGANIVALSAQGASLALWAGSAERMRILSGGNVLINDTTDAGGAGGRLHITGNGSQAAASIKIGTNGYPGWYFVNSSGTKVGDIVINSASTAYNTTSDYRLKNSIAPMTGALAKVARLKPVTYKWNADGSSSQGFIAHELQEVVPDCVTGTKDALKEDGNPEYQGVDTSFLVATLTAAIQELNAKFEAYKATHP